MYNFQKQETSVAVTIAVAPKNCQMEVSYSEMARKILPKKMSAGLLGVEKMSFCGIY